MKTKLRFFLPLFIVAICAGIAYLLIKNKPEQERHKSDTKTLAVEAIRIERQNYQIVLKSRGVVKPRTETTLVSEISGRIIKISDNFMEGEFFNEGEALVQIDDRTYKAEVKIANSELMSSRSAFEQERVNVTNFETQIISAESTLERAILAYKEEVARGKQALNDWERLHPDRRPDELVLRRPQLATAKAAVAAAEALLEQSQRNAELGPYQIAAAKAKVEAAEASLEKRKLDLERTKIIAPFTGIVLTKNVDTGQYISQNTPLANIYAVDYVEIRLPLSNQQLGYINLPEHHRNTGNTPVSSFPSVILTSSLGLNVYKWNGKLIRSEGTFDPASRQLFVIAKVDNPYDRSKYDRPPLKIGQFVEAEIDGIIARDVIVVPGTSVRTGNEVLVIIENNKLQRRTVKSFWSDEENVIISEGISEGEILCITPLNFAIDGITVSATIKGNSMKNGGQ